MRTDLPVKQWEFDYPAQQMLVSMAYAKGITMQYNAQEQPATTMFVTVRVYSGHIDQALGYFAQHSQVST